MNSLFTYFSPFEQFVITPVIPVNLFILAQQLHIMSVPAIDFTISNVTLILFLIFFIATLVIKVIKSPVNLFILGQQLNIMSLLRAFVLLRAAYPSLNFLYSLNDLTDPGFSGHSSL